MPLKVWEKKWEKNKGECVKERNGMMNLRGSLQRVAQNNADKKGKWEKRKTVSVVSIG